MIAVSLDTKDLQRRFSRLASELRDRRQVNRELSIELVGWVFNNFKNEGAEAEDGPWAPLRPATIQRRLAKAEAGARGARLKAVRAARGLYREGKSQHEVRKATGAGQVKILQDSGHLRDSFAPFYDNDTAGVGARASAGVDYAKVHEYGSKAKNIPKRKMLPSKAQGLQMGIRAYNRHLTLARQRADL